MHDAAFLPGRGKQLWLLKVARIKIVEETLLRLLKKIFLEGIKTKLEFSVGLFVGVFLILIFFKSHGSSY